MNCLTAVLTRTHHVQLFPVPQQQAEASAGALSATLLCRSTDHPELGPRRGPRLTKPSIALMVNQARDNRRAQVATWLSIYKIIDRVAVEQGRTRVHAETCAKDKILWSWPLSQELRLELRMKSALSGTGFPGKLTRITGDGHELRTHQDSQVVDFP